MAKEPFDFWQDHSIKFLEMAFKSDRMEPTADPDGEGRHTGACGDTVAIFLKLQGTTIAQMAFQVQGCMNTVACANAVAELIEGSSIENAWELTRSGSSIFWKPFPRPIITAPNWPWGPFTGLLPPCAAINGNPGKRSTKKAARPFGLRRRFSAPF
jgi:nitrogen fixation NifU-like protein